MAGCIPSQQKLGNQLRRCFFWVWVDEALHANGTVERISLAWLALGEVLQGLQTTIATNDPHNLIPPQAHQRRDIVNLHFVILQFLCQIRHPLPVVFSMPKLGGNSIVRMPQLVNIHHLQ